MKNIITSALLLLALLLPATATAQDFEVDGIYYNINGNQVSVSVTYLKNSDGSSAHSYSGDITIPETVDYLGTTYTVASIGSWAFKGCTGLTSVIIPNSVTTIRDSAFEYCTGLTSVTIGNSVTVIDEYAFRGCSGLTSITLPSSLRDIGNDSFLGCSGLTSIAIPDSVTHIGVFAFAFCNNLASTIVIPKTVISIGEGLFHNCPGLPGIVVDSENPTYDSRNHCNAIIETSSNKLIAGCKSTVIPNTVTALGYGAFSGCTSLTNITIPGSVTFIGSFAFSVCNGLTRIAIPSSVTYIGGGAFYNCCGLADVYSYIADPTAISMGNDVFYQDPKHYSSRTLHVPEGTVDAYQADWRWQQFFGQIVTDPSPTFTGVGPYPVIEVMPELSSGLNKIFVVYNTDGVKMNYTSTTDEAVTWERFDYSSGELQIEGMTDITHVGNVTTLNHVIPNTGYHITDGPNIYYYWVVNYADYYLELNDLLYNNLDPCNLMNVNVDGQGDAIPYYTVNGNRQVLDREIKLTYNTLEWDDTDYCWQEREIVENFAALNQGIEIVPPLCNTVFEMRGDRFLEAWDEEQIVEGSYFYTQAVDCRTTAVQEGNWEGVEELGGTAPVHIVYTGFPTDVAVNRTWEMAIDPEFQHVIQLFHQDEVDYTFNYEGTYYMRYRVSNGAGTCATHGVTYTITISKGENIDDIPGDVNHSGEVDIADVNTVVDILLGFISGDYPAADVNGDGEINIADINAIIAIIQGAFEEHEWVDLGLTSGTLWATCNVGANTPEEFGDYFAWGETEPKEVYNEQTYKWSDGHYRLTKYCTDNQYGIVDNKTKLDREDDAAWVNWGPKWCTPSLEQFTELYEECRHQFIEKDGVTFHVLTGPNGNTISLPAAGLRADGSLHNAGSSGYYWQSTLDSDNMDAYCMEFHSMGWGWSDSNRRRGMPVRAVRAASDDNQSFYIEQPMLELGEVPIGESVTGQLKIINDTWEEVTVSGDVEAPFKFTHNGHTYDKTTIMVPSNTFTTVTVTFAANMVGEFNGNVTFRNPALEGGQSVIPVHVRAISDAATQQQWVDLGLTSGTLWATMNVGAGSPEESGDHFAWGETEPKGGYTWENYKWCNGSNQTLTKYCNNASFGTVDGKTELELEDDAAWVNMGSSWRMPSYDQMQELLDNCTLMNLVRNGVKGQLFIGPNGNSIFLPTSEDYWSRTLFGQCYAYKLANRIDEWTFHGGSRCNGYAVRAVRMSQE